MQKLHRCVMCGAKRLSDGVTTHEFTVSGVKFVVEELPAEICASCNESYVTDEDLSRAELTIAAELARRGVRTGEAFRFMRKALGLKSNALAELFDLQPETVSRWEKGTQTLDPRAFALLGSVVVDRLAGREELALERLRALRTPVKAPRRAVRIALAEQAGEGKSTKARKRARKVA
jgi:putative zinc finger/helix-turn-helix YgiT family protein